MNPIERQIQAAQTVAAAADVADSETVTAIKFSLMMVNAEDDETLEVYASVSSDGPFLPLLGSDGTAIEVEATEDEWTVINPEAFAAPFIRFVSSSPTTVYVAGKS